MGRAAGPRLAAEAISLQGVGLDPVQGGAGPDFVVEGQLQARRACVFWGDEGGVHVRVQTAGAGPSWRQLRGVLFRGASRPVHGRGAAP